eukprot:713772-Hanusia_phi.AAC.3
MAIASSPQLQAANELRGWLMLVHILHSLSANDKTSQEYSCLPVDPQLGPVSSAPHHLRLSHPPTTKIISPIATAAAPSLALPICIPGRHPPPPRTSRTSTDLRAL